MNMAYFLGIDVSTTGVKALLIDQQGNVVGSANQRTAALDPPAAVERAGPGGLVERAR